MLFSPPCIVLEDGHPERPGGAGVGRLGKAQFPIHSDGPQLAVDGPQVLDADSMAFGDGHRAGTGRAEGDMGIAVPVRGL
jgi:hypothetical protein